MIRKLIIFTIILFVTFCCSAQNVSPSRAKFIVSVLQNTQQANEVIKAQRAKFDKIYNQYVDTKTLSAENIIWLQKLAADYDIKKFNINNKKMWQQLQDRTDIVPPSLVVAQAAYESNWGKSRFAKEGKNYFGQHCYYTGCGIIPARRNPGSKLEVRKFANMLGSIKGYIHNLNTHAAYASLRRARALERAQHQNISGYALVDGLEKYSQQKAYYVTAIRGIIQKYDLAKYDA